MSIHNKKLCKLIGKRMRTRRKVLGLTLEDMSIATDISVPYLSEVERGKVNMSISTLYLVSNGYQLPISNLFRGIKANEF